MKRNNNGNGTYVKLENGKWQCRMMCKNKTIEGKVKIITGSGKTKDEAFRIASKRKKIWDKMMYSGKEANVKKRDETLKNLYSSWLIEYSNMHNWSGRTLYTIKARSNSMIYNHKIAKMKINLITLPVLDNFFADLSNKYCRKSVVTIYNLFKDFYRDIKTQCIVDENIMLDVKGLNYHKKVKEHKQKEESFKEEKLKIFTEEEITKLIKYIMNSNIKINDKYSDCFLLFMFYTGMRGQELRALTLSDINFENHTININKSLSTDINNNMIWKETKTKSGTRIIAINKYTEDVLKLIIKGRPNKRCKYILCNKKGKWIKYNDFLKKFNKTLEKVGIEKKGRTPHSMRHTFISYAIEQNQLSPLKGKSDLFISRYVGHANLAITQQVYTHISEDKLKEIDYDRKNDILELDFM